MNTETKIDKLFADYSGNRPGAVVIVIKDGQPIFKKAYGQAKVEEKNSMTTQSNLRLASFTKQFTAMCIMKLVERGQLSYESTLKDIFPDFPEYGREVTVKNLLQHTSGLVAYEDLIPDTATVQVKDRDVLQMMMTQDSTYFDPGTAYRYSNSGYAVLAMIVEKCSGKTFAEFLQDNIFAPLAMTNTVAYENGISTVPNRAFGYAYKKDNFTPKDQSLTSAVLGDGGIYSSVEDLFKWDQALYTDKLVSIETFQKAITPGVLKNGEQLDYGFGWRIDEHGSHWRMHHTGETSGFRTVIQRYPEANFSVIILTNRNEPDVFPLADKLTDWFLIDVDEL